MLSLIKARSRRRRLAEGFCASLSARAREPVFFREFGVVDSFDGRFDVLVLHAWLVLDRLRNAGEHGLAQALVNALFVRLDEALREQGAGDIGMNRRMKKMAGAFYGRLRAYGEAPGREGLAEALLRNVYRGSSGHVAAAARLANYAKEARDELARWDPNRGEPDFGALPAAE